MDLQQGRVERWIGMKSERRGGVRRGMEVGMMLVREKANQRERIMRYGYELMA